MAGGSSVETGGSDSKSYDDDDGGRVTMSVLVTCVMAASGGLIFGYDLGISGGVTTMEPFLESFFPDVLRKMAESKPNEYCVYDSHALSAFTSSLYIAGLITSLVAGTLTKAVGRRVVMLAGGATFFVGAAINAAATNVAMLVLGRILLGFGVGFTNQATPVYLAEMAPPRLRGAFSAGFQFFLATGVVVANFTNYGTARLSGWGWRLSLGLAAVPASVLLVSTLFIPDTPSSLLQRGKLDKAREALQRVRGGSDADVEAELAGIARLVKESQAGEEGAYGRILLQRKYRPHLVMAVAVSAFQVLTGVVVVAFFSPVIFRTVGFGSDPALMNAAILGAVNLGSVFLSTFVVDRYGRKVLFMQGGLQMFLSLVAVASILGAKIGSGGEAALPKPYATAVLVLACTFSAGFGWSWGPLSWLVNSEIYPLEIRSAGQSISVAVNLGCTFVQAQTFLSMLCRFKYATFANYAAWVAIMTAFVAAFLPETKGVPLDSMASVWEGHWYWSRFVKEEEKEEEKQDGPA